MGCAIAGGDEIELLLSNLLSWCSVLRNASLKGLIQLVNVLPEKETEVWETLARRVMIARYDPVEENAELAQR